MPARRSSTRCVLGCAFAAALSLSATADSNVQPLNNAGPVFGLAADAGSLLVADAGAGILRLRNRPPLNSTGVVKGVVTQMADLGAFEATVNPDAPEINPNPFDLATLPVAPVSTATSRCCSTVQPASPNICNLPSTINAHRSRGIRLAAP